MNHLAVSQLPAREFPENLLLESNETPEYSEQKILSLVCDYIAVTQFGN